MQDETTRMQVGPEPLRSSVLGLAGTLGARSLVEAISQGPPRDEPPSPVTQRKVGPMPVVKRPCADAWERRFLGLDVVHPMVQVMATSVRDWCHRVVHNKMRTTLLVLAGRSGTGKSHAARCAFLFCQAASMWALDNRYYDHPLDVEFYAWPEVADGFKNGEFGVMTDLVGRDAIVLDDIGAEHDPSSMATEKLCQVLSRREFKHTLITTNYLPESWGEKFDGRIADRLCRNSVIVDLSAVDSYALTV